MGNRDLTCRSYQPHLMSKLFPVILVGVVATPILIGAIAPGFTGPTRELTIVLVRILFPGAGLGNSQGGRHLADRLRCRGSQAFGHNGSGLVVGASTTAAGQSHAFVYAAGRMSDLGLRGCGAHGMLLIPLGRNRLAGLQSGHGRSSLVSGQ